MTKQSKAAEPTSGTPATSAVEVGNDATSRPVRRSRRARVGRIHRLHRGDGGRRSVTGPTVPVNEAATANGAHTVAPTEVSANTTSDAIRHSLTTEFREWNEKGIKSIIEKGRVIQRGKDELSKKEYAAWVIDDLRLKPYAAGLYVYIFKNPILSDEKNWKHLPGDYRTLYELSQIDEDKLRGYITKGGVHHDMERSAASKLKNDNTDKKRKDPLPPPPIANQLKLLMSALRYFHQDKEWRAYMYQTLRPNTLPSKEDMEAGVEYVEKQRLRKRGER
jgi:hypothetical protein